MAYPFPAERQDSGVAMDTCDNQPPRSLAYPSTDVDETILALGIDTMLDYLNHGNTPRELKSIRHKANTWCQHYYNSAYYVPRDITAVLAEHPNLFDFKMPSYERLDMTPKQRDRAKRFCSPQSVLGGSDTDSDSGYDTGRSNSTSTSTSTSSRSSLDRDEPFVRTCTPTLDCPAPTLDVSKLVPFPAYSEPLLVTDQEMRRIVERYDATVSARETAYKHEGLPVKRAAPQAYEITIRGADLLGSPIIYFIPDVICHLAHLYTGRSSHNKTSAAARDSVSKHNTTTATGGRAPTMREPGSYSASRPRLDSPINMKRTAEPREEDDEEVASRPSWARNILAFMTQRC